MGFSDFIKSVLVGFPWGEVYPTREVAPVPPAFDGRTAALTTLATYLSELTFFRQNKPGEPMIAFQVPRERIYVEFPDDEAETRLLPAIALISAGEGNYNALGLALTEIDEASRDKYGRNTALVPMSNYVENITIEVLCKTKQERRALREGMQAALNPSEAMAGIRFRMPDYFDQVCTFVVNSSTMDESEMSMKQRYSLKMNIELSFVEVRLVNVSPLEPVITSFVDQDPDDPTAVLELETDHVDLVGEEVAEQDPP